MPSAGHQFFSEHWPLLLVAVNVLAAAFVATASLLMRATMHRIAKDFEAMQKAHEADIRSLALSVEAMQKAHDSDVNHLKDEIVYAKQEARGATERGERKAKEQDDRLKELDQHAFTLSGQYQAVRSDIHHLSQNLEHYMKELKERQETSDKANEGAHQSIKASIENLRLAAGGTK
jgi:chromosome segregation ATPase